MTIITQTRDGRTRRCDACCHNAKGPKCRCVCGGRYHGKREAAREMFARDALGEGWRERKAEIEAAGGDFAAMLAAAAWQAEGGGQMRLFEP